MKRIVFFAFFVLIATQVFGDAPFAHAAAVKTPPGQVCLYLRDIERTETTDDRTILFHMRDGKTWRNTLRTACPMLKSSSFTQVVHSDMVCANQQFIHVNLTGDECVLGDFTPEPARH